MQTLYKICLKTYVSNLNYGVRTLESVECLRLLPPVVLVDIYAKMSCLEKLRPMLNEQLTDLVIFERLLRFTAARQKLFKCLSALVSAGIPIAKEFQNKFVMRYMMGGGQLKESITISDDISFANSMCSESQTQSQVFSDDFDLAAIDFGLRLGSFLSEAGLISESINVLTCVAYRLETFGNDYSTMLVRLDCLQRLLHSEAILCSFKTADRTFKTILQVLVNIENDKIPQSLLSNLYTQLSVFFFSRSEYDKSYKWSLRALHALKSSAPEKIVIDVLRQAAKSCVVKREFKRANLLICIAVGRARVTFGRHHQKYADALLDYGFFLLNVDSVFQSVNVYKEALDIKRHIFGSKNFHVAIAHEDLSYAYYVYEYSSGNFTCARDNVEKAIKIMKDLVPNNHLLLSSAKRVKALLLEEIALDKMVGNGKDEDGLLLQSEALHKCALQLSLEAFGEINVQTAKHYGNLGRLYQTMAKFEEAERMHKKAIKIKTDLLGPYDYEVGLSIGHLASLYNYHMKKYREAEALYLRSIEISLRLFGKTYSGLEYDYLGLCHVYEILADAEKYLEYAGILDIWQNLRGENDVNMMIQFLDFITRLQQPMYPQIRDETALEEITKKFFEMTSNPPTYNIQLSLDPDWPLSSSSLETSQQ